MPADPAAPSTSTAPAPKQGPGSLSIIMLLPLVMIVFLDPGIRIALGSALGALFTPLFGFGGLYPLWTLFITSIVLIIFTTVVRHFFTDWLAMGRQKHVSNWVQKQYSEVRLKGNVTKMKKLNEYQAEMMKQSGDQMGSQMKTTLVTMVVALAIFVWLSVFMYSNVACPYFSVPWAPLVSLNSPGPFLHMAPTWMVLYSLLSLPLGQVLAAALKIFSFRRKLDTLSRSSTGPESEGDGV